MKSNVSTKRMAMSILTICIVIKAAGQFTLSGEIRPRTEMSHGYKALAAKNQDLSTVTTQRTRLNLLFINNLVKSKLVLQDVRLYGSQRQLVGNEDLATSVHEAWAEIMFLPSLSLKIGRQEVVYDDHRIFGSVGWAQQARSHDMAVFKYESALKIHLGLAHHEDGILSSDFYSGPDMYKDLQFLWVNYNTEPFSLSGLLLNKGNNLYGTDTTGTDETIYTRTAGIRLVYKKDGLTGSLFGYFQKGENLKAFDFGADASYKVSGNTSLSAGFEILSGNDTTTTDQEAFNPFFGTNHKFNGFMDYFYVGNHINTIGLVDLFLKGQYSLGKSTLSAHGHYFAGATDHIAGFDGKSLGIEIDLVCSYKISEITNISAGYSQMFGTDNMAVLKGGDKSAMSYWAWVMITVKPVFFTTKKSD